MLPTATHPPAKTPAGSSPPGTGRRLVRLMDALARGASPPGMIDMVHTRHSHLRRRFVMIARYEGKNGRWSAAGLAVSLVVAGVAFTGAVSGQDAVGPTPPAAPTAPAAPAPDAGPAPAAQVAAERAPAAGAPKADPSKFGAADAAKLWEEKYANRIYMVNGRAANKEQVDREFRDEVRAAAGSDARADQLLRQAAARLQARPEELRPPAPAGPPQEAGPAEVADEDVDAALLAQLDRKLPELNFDGAALSDVVDFLRDVSGTNMVVEWGQMADAGVDRNAPVSLRVRDIKFSRALDLVLSGAAPGVVLGYAIDGNVIRISTGDHLDRFTDVRAYDVRDILASEAKMEDLTRLITETVARDSWRDAGGSIGAIHPTRNKLVITQTSMNHRQIRSVLQMLRDEPREPVRAADAASAAHAPQPTQPARR